MPSPLADFRVVALPDFFLDHLVPLPPWARTRRQLDDVARRGGGNLHVGPIATRPGGNATNLALALARLGAKVELVAATDVVGGFVLGKAARGLRLDLHHVAVGPASAATVALEAADANVMVSHAGPVADFGPRRIPAAAWRAIESADAVAVCNWAQNRQGTALLAAVARRARGRVFADLADASHRRGELRALLAQPFWRRVRSLAVNANELRLASGGGPSPAVAAARLARRLGCRVDAHDRGWAGSTDGQGWVEAPALGGRARRLTGAGDAWNAGNIAGDMLGLDAGRRLRLAHRVATAYVTSRDGAPPGWRDVRWPA